jgi:hypothetical protein
VLPEVLVVVAVGLVTLVELELLIRVIQVELLAQNQVRLVAVEVVVLVLQDLMEVAHLAVMVVLVLAHQ